MSTSKVNLLDILEAFNFQFDDTYYYLDRRTNIVFSLTTDDVVAADSGDDIEEYPAWQRESIEIAMEIEDDMDGNFLRLPSKYDINDYEIMVSFCETVKNVTVKYKLSEALIGKGSFRRFKDTVLMNGIEQDWYQYRDETYLQIAAKWCEENSLGFESL